MSIGLMQAVWDVGPEDAVDCSVLVSLANFAGDDGSNCFPSIELIAKMIRRSTRTVVRSISSLEEAGWLKVGRGSGRGNRSQYELNIERLLTLQSAHLQNKAKGVRVSRFPQNKGCQSVTVSKTTKGDTQTTKGDSDGLLIRKNHQEPSKVKQPSPTLPEGGLKIPKQTGINDGPLLRDIVPQTRQPRQPRQTAAERQQAARAAIGSTTPVTPMRERSVVLSSADVRGGLQRALADVREQLVKLRADYADMVTPDDDFVGEWDAAMERVEYERHEAPEGRVSGLVVSITSPVPKLTVERMKQYETRIEAALRVQLASRVQLVVMAVGEVAA